LFIIEYFTRRAGPDAPPLHSELALGHSLEEAKDQAESHFTAARAKFGASGYRILDEEKQLVGGGPHLNPSRF
jgi:hypothetical protein